MMLRAKPKPDYEIKPDGRLILWSQKLYHAMRVKLCELANSRCENEKCQKYTPVEMGEAHHQNGRGMAASKRDDRIWVGEKRNLYWYCRHCHRGHDSIHAPKAVPAKPTDEELARMLGL